MYEQRRAESLKIMADTDAKRGKINELLDYIENRLTELEEEKEELKEFQEKDKERRCMEYALYQRELEEVGETLVEIEEDRRLDVHGSNVRRDKFNAHEKEIQDLDNTIADARHSLETVAQTRRDTQFELTDFIRTRTELECIVADLRAANENSGGRREDLESELKLIQAKIAEKEAVLDELLPEWEEQRALESTEKRRLDEASAKLAALYAKQGRATKFRTKSERDTFLKHEISSVTNHKANQEAAFESTQAELQASKRSQQELDNQVLEIQEKLEDGRNRVKDLAENMTTLKEKHLELTEKRKDLWREDTKLDSLVSRAVDELRTSERSLAGMMDKVIQRIV